MSKVSINDSEKNRLVNILNSLEFKDDVLSVGGEIYAVGGIVRDAIMGTPSDDLDIVVRGIPYDELFDILSKYGHAVDTSHVDENGKKDFGSTKYISKNKEFNKFLEVNGIISEIDIMLPRKDQKDPGVKGHKGIKSDVNYKFTIQDDLDRRDITINAIAINLSGEIIVNSTGLEDINNGIIKAVSKESFIEDPLRMLRAVRFAARYNYDWDKETIELIMSNCNLLSDKQEMPRERFLIEFNKMIGKPDLGKAVNMLVDFGLYKSMFGVESKIVDYKKFDNIKSVGEMSFMMFENEPLDDILNLVEENITNDKGILKYVKALVEYKKEEGVHNTILEKCLFISRLYKISEDAMRNASFLSDEYKKIVNKFEAGKLPIDEHELKFKGEDFKLYIIGKISETLGGFSSKKDGIKIGRAKKYILHRIYEESINNDLESIKNELDKNKSAWIN